jgi:hypothetical protein
LVRSPCATICLKQRNGERGSVANCDGITRRCIVHTRKPLRKRFGIPAHRVRIRIRSQNRLTKFVSALQSKLSLASRTGGMKRCFSGRPHATSLTNTRLVVNRFVRSAAVYKNTSETNPRGTRIPHTCVLFARVMRARAGPIKREGYSTSSGNPRGYYTQRPYGPHQILIHLISLSKL